MKRCERQALFQVRFSNRPFGVKRFQTICRCSVDVAHGLVLLFGILKPVPPFLRVIALSACWNSWNSLA